MFQDTSPSLRAPGPMGHPTLPHCFEERNCREEPGRDGDGQNCCSLSKDCGTPMMSLGCFLKFSIDIRCLVLSGCLHQPPNYFITPASLHTCPSFPPAMQCPLSLPSAQGDRPAGVLKTEVAAAVWTAAQASHPEHSPIRGPWHLLRAASCSCYHGYALCLTRVSVGMSP